jgi:ribosomal protein L11 methyltransferase
VASYLELSFELGARDPAAAEAACTELGAIAVTFGDAADDPVLEPAPGEMRLWPATRVVALFDLGQSGPLPGVLAASLGEALGLAPRLIRATGVADRAWEREWLKDFHAMRFGRRLWVCPRHERVADPGAVVVTLDPGMAFGTGTHPSTALCLQWLDSATQDVDANAHELCALPGAEVIDYGCGSGILALACAHLGARAVHCFDIDPQALIATRENALANGVAGVVHVHAQVAGLPPGADLLLANILCGPLCELAPAFAARVRRGGQVVLAGLMDAEAAEVTAAYAPWFDVSRSGDRDGWTCLAGRRR